MKKMILWTTGAVLAAALSGVLFILVRQARAAGDADRKWHTSQVLPLGDIGSTGMLEILPLYEEAGDPGLYEIGHGLAYLLRTDSATILLDAGNNPEARNPTPLSANMQALEISWEEIDAAVFSHFHPDHVGGVAAWKAGTFSFGEGTPTLQDRPVYVPASFDTPGARPVFWPDPTIIAPGVATIGAITYGETYPMSLYAAQGAEQALAINIAGEGILLVMGCGHPTVERIVARVEAVFGRPVVGIVGGFHYEGVPAGDLQSHLDFLQSLHLQLIAPSPHDSDQDALARFRSAFPDVYQEVRVGAAFVFPENP